VEWDLASARETGRLSRGAHAPGLSAHAYGLSPDGKILAAPGVVRTAGGLQEDGVVHLWDTTTGKELCTLQGALWVRSVQFGPGGKLVAMDSKDSIQVCDSVTGKRRLHIPGQRPHGGTVVFSPDGKSLAWAGDGLLNGVIHVWDMATQKLRSWPAGQHKTRVLAFTPDSRSIAGADRGDIRVWNTATGKERMSVRGPDWVESLVFSPTGRVLTAGGEAGQILLWEVPTGQEIRRLVGPQGMICCLAFAADGRTLASGGGDTTILLWDLAGTTNNKTDRKADVLWSDLAENADKAYPAIWTLTRRPKDSVSYLKEKLHPAVPADVRHMDRLIADLESKAFSARDQASRELEKLGEAAEPGLRKLLAGNPSLEVRRRVERVLQKRGKDVLRQERTIEALELMATPEARQVLEWLVQTASNPHVAQAAAEGGERLRAR
jgi:WD40 repeat protein